MWVQTDRSTASSEPCGLPDRAVVVGIGTVGLHRALSLDRIGIDVTGYDIDETAVAAYRRGVDATGVIGDDDIAASDCTFTTDPDCIGDADAVFVAVPTNYDHETSASKHGQLDGDRARSEQRRGDGLAAVRAAAETIGGRLTPETIVVLESTVPPGATQEQFTPSLAAASGFEAGREFAVALSPVRFSPGTPSEVCRRRTKLVAAAEPAAARSVAALFDRVYDSVRIVETPATAAAAKCVENVYRDVNIALVNELAEGFDALGLDTEAVLDAAATKWNVPRFEPGLVGGSCLPTDPHLLADRLSRAGQPTPLVRLARATNEAVPGRIAVLTVDALAVRYDRWLEGEHSGDGIAADGAGSADGVGDTGGTAAEIGTAPSASSDRAAPVVLLLGLTYKANVSDISGTQSTDVAAALDERGVEVVGYDPLLDADQAEDALPFDVRREDPFESVDAVVILVNHDAFGDLTRADLTAGNDPAPAVVDVPNCLDDETAAELIYRSH